MKHARQKIRERFVADLAALAGGRVYRTRIYPKSTLPAIAVYSVNERSENEAASMSPTAPRRYTRELDIAVEIAAEAVTNVDDAVDDLAAQVEALLAADVTLNGLATDCTLVGTTHDTLADGTQQIYTARLDFLVWYRTTALDPESAL